MNFELEDNEKIMEFVKEYFEFHGYEEALENLDKEWKVKELPKCVPATSPHAPQLVKIFEAEGMFKEEEETEREGKLKELNR